MGFVGYAVQWDSGPFAPGAFRRTLALRSDVRCTIDGRVLGTVHDGSVTLTENAEGLLLELQPWHDSADVAWLRAAVQRGEMPGLRVCIRALDVAIAPAPRRHRTILEAALLAIAIVRPPQRATPGTWLAAKTPASTWRATEADLHARTRALEEELEELETGC
jgi:phage head maturation protease